jgi:hypothetical protein
MEALSSSETSVLTRATRRNTPRRRHFSPSGQISSAGKVKNLHFPISSRLALLATQPAIQRVLAAFLSVGKAAGCKADNSLQLPPRSRKPGCTCPVPLTSF